MNNNNTKFIEILHQLFGMNIDDLKLILFIFFFIFFYLILVFVVFYYRDFFKNFSWFQFFEKNLRNILEKYSILVFLILVMSFFFIFCFIVSLLYIHFKLFFY